MAEPRNFSNAEIEFIRHRYFACVSRLCGSFVAQPHTLRILFGTGMFPIVFTLQFLKNVALLTRDTILLCIRACVPANPHPQQKTPREVLLTRGW
jgi:hypothetical protein